MDYHWLEALRKSHPAWRLLAAAHAPFVIGFLHHAFVRANVRTYSEETLVARLDDYLFHLRQRLGEGVYPRSGAQYLDDWSGDDHGWLRRYYPSDSDEPQVDLTPAAEKAIAWVAGFETRSFIGTESRLRTVFELLRQIVEGTEPDPAQRIAELERKKVDLDAEIQRIRGGRLDIMDGTQIKDRFLQVASTARALLSDFREVDQNFRDLDRAVREKIALWDGSKGTLLDEFFGDRDAINDSDQGKSFRAFWDFLVSPARQEELTGLLEAVFALPPVRELAPDPRLLRVHYDWLEAGEVAQRTVARLSEQLRRYLDDQAWLENRRIMQILRDVEQRALEVRDRAPEGAFIEIAEAAPELVLPLERPLYSRPLETRIDAEVRVGVEDAPLESLYDLVVVDKARLLAQVRRALQTRTQVPLSEIVAAAPLEHGLAELVTYLSLAAEDRRAVIDDARTETFVWEDAEGGRRRATLPLVIFTRGG